MQITEEHYRTCKGLVTCSHEDTGRDADRWCTRCESPADKPGKVNCPCQLRADGRLA